MTSRSTMNAALAMVALDSVGGAPRFRRRPEDEPPHIREAAAARVEERKRLAALKRARKAQRIARGFK